MLTKDYILEQINKYCTLDEDLCEGTFSDLVISPLEDAGCFENWTWDCGVTKGVLIFKDLDYVIKIPFYCEYEEAGEDWDEDTQEWIPVSEGGPLGEPFQGVQVEGYIHDNDWDYCETEAIRYEVAQKNNVEEYFAKTWYIGSVQEWPIYAQIRANMYASEDSRSTRRKTVYTDKQRETVRSIQDATHFGADEEWMMDFINYYSQDALMELIQFCDEWFIDDLHNGNLGYICGAPCIVDYSSFNC